MSVMTIDTALARIRLEFQERPDLKLTLPQVRRLCDLPEDVCARAIERLIDSGFLRTSGNGCVLSGARSQSRA